MERQQVTFKERIKIIPYVMVFGAMIQFFMMQSHYLHAFVMWCIGWEHHLLNFLQSVGLL